MPGDAKRSDLGLSGTPGQPGPARGDTALIKDTQLANGTARPDAALAGSVHDLRNMLTIVLASLEQLRRQSLDARGQQQLERAEWSARQAGQLARELLASARDEAASAAAAIVDLNEAVRAFAATLGGNVDGDARLAVELAEESLPVRLDRSELERVLLNLVRNATDAMTDGGQIMIRTVGHRVDGLGGHLTVEVAVSDTGTGMAPEVVRHATEAFYTTKGPGHGSGLGLWVARRFAEDAGGKIAIETAPGQGTTVSLILPRAEAG